MRIRRRRMRKMRRKVRMRRRKLRRRKLGRGRRMRRRQAAPGGPRSRPRSSSPASRRSRTPRPPRIQSLTRRGPGICLDLRFGFVLIGGLDLFGLEIWICFVIYQVLRAALLLPVDTLAVELEGLVARVDGHATRALGASVQVQVRGAGAG